MDNIFGDTDKVRDIENQEIYKDKVVSRCSLRTGLLSTLQIKRLKEDKVKHKEALTLLRHICEEVGKTNKYNDMGEHYFEATNAAAVNDTPEAIEEMVMHCPQAIWSNTNDYYIIQSAILNRTEKVYNLLVHEMNINMFFHKVMKDKDGNNLLHLAAQLAPIHKLNVVSGAALQMQRELQWFLLMLFLSVTSLMVAFSAALYIVSGQENNWILIPIAALTCLPVASFVTLQFPLLVELISSTYGRGIFGKQNDNTKARTWFVMFLCVGFGL
ncbi:hypothetical protein HanIR_Chr06g0257741 [Helianthus annuus]|nr:hypothetical protein HanIR_Chr06g0257741 [Helianthus annuus]